MKFKQAFLVIICIIGFATAAQAAVVKQMYEVYLPVTDQNKSIRKAAFEQAFIETLVRVSGSGMAPTQVNISKAATYVQQYRYLPLLATDAPVLKPSNEGVPEAKYRLWVKFNQRAIKKLLRDNGLPIWGQQRPSVLVWLAVRDGSKRYVLKQQHQSPIKKAVEEEALRRGLPIIWPDNNKKSAEFVDIWGGFWQPIKKASVDYSADAILVGRMSWHKGSWQINWSMQLGDQASEDWQLQAIDLNMVMASGIDLATDQIASRFAVFDDAATEAELVVQVDGIQQLDDYARTVKYLSVLAPIKQLFATEVSTNQVKFHIDLNGDKEDLRRIIALGRVLIPNETAYSNSPQSINQPATSLANQLNYSLKP